MPAALTPIRVADDVFEFAVGSPSEAQALSDRLRREAVAEDVVAGLDRVAVRFDPADWDRIHAWIQAVKPALPTAKQAAAPIEIAIQYGGAHGPDFDAVCQALGLSPDACIDAHTAPVHTVEMIGFTPGFSYLSGLPDGFNLPRLNQPRPRVPAGSVGVSATYSGIYALNGPGGWPLIGHTDAALFRADREDPFLLTPGQRVRFRAR